MKFGRTKFTLLSSISLCILIAEYCSGLDELLFEKTDSLKGFRCAGQEEECSSGLCFDSIHVSNDFVETGCATTNMCNSTGCSLNEPTQKFICCCAHPFCNGKSHRMVKARWRMFQNGDYHQSSDKQISKQMTPRLIPRNVAVPQPKTAESFPEDTTPTRPQLPRVNNGSTTVAIKKPDVAKEQPKVKIEPAKTTAKPAPATTKSLPKAIVTVKTTKIVKTTAAPKSSSAFSSTVKAAKTTTKKVEQKAPTTPSSLTEKPLTKTKTDQPIFSTIALPEYITKKVQSEGTTTTAQVIPKVTNAPAKMPAVAPKEEKSVTKFIKNVDIRKPANGNPTQEQAPTTSQPIVAPIVIEKLEDQPHPAFTTTTMVSAPTTTNTTQQTQQGSKRTTRSPTSNNSVDSYVPSTYPWYWVCLLGFATSVVVALVVFACMRHCGFRCGRRGGLNEEAGHDSNHQDTSDNNSINETTQKNGKTYRKVYKKRRADNNPLIKSKHVGNGTTDDSLVSRCTTVTTASSINCSDVGFGEEDGMRELTVIDPLLNKSYSGTLQTSPEKTTKY